MAPLHRASNDQAERRAGAKRIAGHHSLHTFDPPCSRGPLPRDRSSRLLDCRAPSAPKLTLNSTTELTPGGWWFAKTEPPSCCRCSTEAAHDCANADAPCAAAAAPNRTLGVRATDARCIRTFTPDAEGRDRSDRHSGAAGESTNHSSSAIKVNLTMRLSDAGLRR
jgi:hypothetical protein